MFSFSIKLFLNNFINYIEFGTQFKVKTLNKILTKNFASIYLLIYEA